MAFHARLGFVNENVQKDFTERLLPKLPGSRIVEEAAPAPDENDIFTHWTPLSISSPTAARDLCHQLTGFLNHHKQSGLLLQWKGGDESDQSIQLTGQQRDAEIAGMRLSAAVKAHNDAEKAAAKAADK
jgi:hypothetical protein